ncbi:MAG: TIGR02117 family protein [Chitinophagaceae bacterium]|nr:TIGR02117 family protein [Chitinophagaceae bacterium]
MFIRKLIIILLKTLLLLLILLALYALAVWLLPYIAVNKEAGNPNSEDVSIYIKTNGVHTDIVVPVKNNRMDWTQLIRYEHTDAKDSSLQYVGIGWGDKGFYLQTPEWKDLKFSVAFKAMFHLSSSAIHATFYNEIVTGEDCKEIRISNVEYDKLVQYIKDTFQKDAGGNSIHIPSTDDGYGATDAFYEANGKYDLFHTCNTWANSALKACNQRACLWTALDGGIFYQYKDR